jgi:hypothetical protein
MTDLVAFLAARLDEDEAAAKWWIAEAPSQEPCTLVIQTGFDGERMLREVKAKRKILALLASAPVEDVNAGIELEIQRHMAAVWSDHPDCDPAWKQ